MKIFLSYGHDSNAKLVEHIRSDLAARGHDVWLDREKINFGDDWRRAITEGILGSDWVLSFLSKHSARDPGVCLDELAVAIGVKDGIIHTVLVESESEVTPPVSVSHIQWLDMHDWKDHWDTDVNAPHQDGWYAGKVNEIISVVESDNNRRFAGEIDILKKKLKPISPDTRISELLGQGFVGRQWLVRDIDRWLQENQASRVFLLTGEPGVGKSAFAAWLAHHNKSNIIAAYYIEFNKPYFRDPRRIITSIAFQIATRLPDYRKLLTGLPDIDNLGEMNAAELFVYLIAEPLRKSISGNRMRYAILIDALDEATDDGHNSLVDLIARESLKLPDWITFIITSRPYSAILRRLSHLSPLEIDADDSRNREDLADFIRKWLVARNIKDNVDSVTSAIVAASEGNFLYLRNFCEGVTQKWIDVEDAQKYPKGMTGMYEEYFKRQVPDIKTYQRDQVPLLQLIVAGFEPVPEDLATNVLEWTGNDRVKLFEPLESVFKKENGLIVPFHKSLIDWLTNHERSGKYYVNADEGHHRLAEYFWNQFTADSSSMTTYARSHIIQHLIKTNRSDRVVELLTNIKFVQQKYLTSIRFDVVNDYREAFDCFTANQETSYIERIVSFLSGVVSKEYKQADEENTGLSHVHVAVNIAVAFIDQPNLHESMKKVLLTACCHGSTNIRTLGVLDRKTHV